MDKEIKLLAAAVDASSQGVVSKELGISKTSVNLLLKQKYPNPKKMYEKINAKYTDEPDEIIGISVSSVKELEDLIPILKEIG